MPSSIHIGHLCCENLTNPLGIDTPRPRLSWILESSRRGARQTAYQVLAAGSEKLLQMNQGNLWDSGKQPSNSSHHVSFGGGPLPSRAQCFWKVRVWDDVDKPSAWSATALWSIGFLRENDWSAKWIGLAEGVGDMTAPWLRKIFHISSKPGSAWVYANFMGYGEIYINGRRVGNDVLSPQVCDYSKRSFYSVYDVTSLLQQGENCLGLWMGRGWYKKDLFWPVAHDGPIARVQLEWKEAGKPMRCLNTNARWEGTPSCMQLLGSWNYDQFGGELLDASAEVPDWNHPKPGGHAWTRVALVHPPQVPACAPMVQQNRIVATLQPAGIRQLAGAECLVDMGRACTGWVELRLPRGKKGSRVIMEFGDAFERGTKSVPFPAVRTGDRLNSANQRSEYVYRGHGEELFRNRFNYASFRYIRILNLPGKLESRHIQAHLITTDLPIVGAFKSSSRIFNKIHDTMLHTLRCLMLGGYQVDCHSRERLGYGGDGQSSLETTLTMLRSDALYSKWTNDWLDSQRPDGGLPHTAPCPVWAGGGPFWCGFLIAATWRNYMHYGDLALMRRNYPAMVNWLQYVARHTKTNLLRQWPAVNYRNWYLGDWATPDGIDQKHPESIDLFCNCYIIYALELMEKMAAALELDADVKRWRKEAARRRPAVHRAFYHPSQGTYADGDQIDLIMPLMAGVVPGALRKNIFRKFEHELMVKHHGHLATGLSGTYMMIQYLQAIGRNDLVYAFASKTTAPSWGYMLRHGATATWEYWTDQRSRIHNCYNSIGSWFYQGLAGIFPDPAGPGFKKIIIRPSFPAEIKSVSAAYNSVHGKIECSWQVSGKRANVEVSIPANTQATVKLPAGSIADIKESGKPAKHTTGVKSAEFANGQAIIEIASGRYWFSLPRPESVISEQ